MMIDAAASRRGGLGWVLILGALAMPAILFYHWWAGLRTDHNKLIAAKTSRRSGSIFESLPEGRVKPSSLPVAQPVLFNTAAPVSAAIWVPAAAPAGDAETAPARDPMQSPSELASLRAQTEPKVRPRRSKTRSRQPPLAIIEKEVHLQGIVAKPDGEVLAIINDAVVGPGQSFAVGSRHERVKVLSVSASTVTFQFGRSRFTKHVSR